MCACEKTIGKQKNLLEEYKKLNASYSRELIFRLGIGGGFFSEYNNMLVVMLYCIQHKIQFKLDSVHANFSVEKGWQDYFEPFCEEVVDEHIHYKSVDWRYLIKTLMKGKRIAFWNNILPYFRMNKKRLLTQDVFGRARSRLAQNSRYQIPQLGISGGFREACAVLLELTWRYNEETKMQINETIKNLYLPEQYVGFHIRGGDKGLEYQLYPIEEYFNKVKQSEIKDAFVLTDDYRIFETCVEKYPDWRFWTLCEEQDLGYDNSSFMQEDSSFKRRKLIRLFAAMEILTSSVQFIGTYSANPGLFLGMRIPEKTDCVDWGHWRIW